MPRIAQDRVSRSRLDSDPPHVLICPPLESIGYLEFHGGGLYRIPAAAHAISGAKLRAHCHAPAAVYAWLILRSSAHPRAALLPLDAPARVPIFAPDRAVALGADSIPNPIRSTLDMARQKNRDIAWERAAIIRGKNPSAWRRDERGNRIRYGSFGTRGKYAWTLERGKAVSTALR